MIFNNQASDAAVLVGQLLARGYRLEAQPGTPLRSLTDKYVISYSDISATTPGQPIDVAHVVRSSNGMDSHLKGLPMPQDLQQESLGTAIAEEVVRHMAYVRHCAVPLLSTISERYVAELSKQSFAPPDHTIVVLNSPEEAMDVQVREQIEKFAVGLRSIVRRIPLNCSLDLIKGKILEGYPGCDWLVQWFAVTGDPRLETIHTHLFTDTGDSSSTIEGLITGDDSFAASFYAFLATMILHNDPPTEIKMTLEQYNNAIYALRCRVAQRLKYMIEEWTSLVETKTIYRSYTSDRIEVVKPVYEEFIEGGGTVGILSSIVRMANPVRTLDELLVSRDKIELEHRRQLLMATTSMQLRKYVVMRDVLMFVAMTEFNAVFNKVYPDAPEQLGDRDTWPKYKKAKEMIQDAIDHMPSVTLEDGYAAAAELVSKCIFSHAPVVEKMITGMTEAKRINPKATTDECALLACYAYVFDFVLDQISVIKI